LSREEALAQLRAGHPQAAAALLETQLQRSSADAEAWFLLGACRHALNDLAAAASAFSRSVVLAPANAEANLAYISVLRAGGNARGAFAASELAHTHCPGEKRLLYAAALCLEDLGRFDDALRRYESALDLDPAFEDALHNRGLLLARLERYADAEASQRSYIRNHPGAARAHSGLADILIARGRFDESMQALEAAERLDPDDASVRVRQGVVLASVRKYAQARNRFNEARRRDAPAVARYLQRVAPGGEPAYMLSPENIYLGRSWRALGECDWSGWDEYVAEMRKIVHAPEILIEPAVAFMSRLLPLSGVERHAIARGIAARIEAAVPALPGLPPRERRRLRIGVLSPDFREHLNSYLLLPLFELLDRERFELYAYALAADDKSAIRERVLRAADVRRDLHDLSDRDAALAVRGDDIDILLDVGGHTTGARFAITAQRPARIQVSYLGFSCSLGSTRIDHAIVDAVVDGTDDEWTEDRVFLPHTHFLYDFRAPAPAPAVPLSRSQYGLPEDAFVFCAFHRAEKITPDVFELWMRILSRAPRSVLWFRGLSDVARLSLGGETERRGVDPRRLAFAPFEASQDPRYLARHRLGDLMLDSLHHNAMTSACDALGAGLPLLTLRGNALASRAGDSLLRAAGLPELVANDKQGYVETAVQLATDRERLNGFRRTLEARTGPLFDTASRVREIESALLQMWQRYQQRH
jgi:predicted O-linked N-acetylglucosamine transferase (SPINDLY family)